MDEVHKKELEIMRFRNKEVNFEAHLMTIETPQNVHKISFLVIWMTFTWDFKCKSMPLVRRGLTSLVLLFARHS